MIIDSHAHVMLPPERHIELMAEAHIDQTILFTTMVHPETTKGLKELETELNQLYEILNGVRDPLRERIHALEELAQIVGANPDKYIGFGSIPFGLSYKENLGWIEKYVVGNGFRGIGELTPGTGQVPQMDALFRAVQEVGSLPLWVHTFFPLKLEDIKALLDLARQYPTVPVIIGHLGGIHWLDTLQAAKEIPNVYLDLSATFTTLAPSLAIRELPERTLFSSDAPYASPLIAKMILEHLTTDNYVLEQVLGGNIAKLLQLAG
ncbi:amidohydrolase [Lucifera butyrica]|uniref:Amidohydrolase n=1 Tax=Lucifera butyrica TaxID=1351585 RepID=A0A498RDY8_9FIRM|nr:amidohydrolase family protein [Lucifera butyrica]VBB09040.1 amidohydrolase [Lucifera butyrica]